MTQLEKSIFLERKRKTGFDVILNPFWIDILLIEETTQFKVVHFHFNTLHNIFVIDFFLKKSCVIFFRKGKKMDYTLFKFILFIPVTCTIADL